MSETDFPPTTTQPNVGSGKEIPEGGKGESERRGCWLPELQEQGFVTVGLGNPVPTVDRPVFIPLLVTSPLTVLCLLTFGYLLFSVLNLIYSNYTVLGNSQTIKNLYFTLWMHLSTPIWFHEPQVQFPSSYHTSESITGLINHLLHSRPTGTWPVHFPTVQPTFSHLVNTFSSSPLLPKPSLTCLGSSLGMSLLHLRPSHISWLFHHSQDCCSTLCCILPEAWARQAHIGNSVLPPLAYSFVSFCLYLTLQGLQAWVPMLGICVSFDFPAYQWWWGPWIETVSAGEEGCACHQ